MSYIYIYQDNRLLPISAQGQFNRAIYQSKLFYFVICLLPISSSMLQLESSEQKQTNNYRQYYLADLCYTNRKI